MTYKRVSPDELTAHPENPYNATIINDVDKIGVKEDIRVTDNSHFADGRVVIGGHRRVGSAVEFGIETVPISEPETFETPADELEAILRDNNYRDKTFTDRMGEADMLRDIEERKANERKEANLKQNDDTERQNLAGRSRDKIAERVGIGSGETYRKARKVWDAAKDGNEMAQDLVDDLDSEDTTPHGAYTDFKAIQDFEVSPFAEDFFNEIKEKNVLSSEQLRELKTDDPSSIVQWMSKRGINPFADGTIEPARTEVTRLSSDFELVENANIPIEDINTEICRTAYGDKEIDDEKFGPLSRNYAKRDGTGVSVNVAPAENGEFELLDWRKYTRFKAHELVKDEILVHVRNVDGTEDLEVKGHTMAIENMEMRTNKPNTVDEIENAMDQLKQMPEEEDTSDTMRLLEIDKERAKKKQKENKIAELTAEADELWDECKAELAKEKDKKARQIEEELRE